MKYIFILIPCLAPWGAFAQNKYTLEQCLMAADAYQPLAKHQALIDAAHKAAVAQLRANYYPQASFNGQATWQSDVTEVPLRFPGVEIPTISKDQYRLTLDLSQSIWDGGQIAAQTAVQEAQTKIERQRNHVDRYATREQIVALYCAALLSQQQTQVLAAHKQDIAGRKARIEEQIGNGAAIPANAYAFEARLLELEQQEEDAVARKEAAMNGLALLTGFAIKPEDALQQPEAAAPSTDDAAIQRPEITLFSLQQQIVPAQERLLRAKMMPRFNAIATLGYGRPGLNMLSNDFNPYAIVGLNFRWNLHPLYSGSVNKEKEQLRLQSERVSAQREQFLLQTEVRRQQQNREIDRLEKTLQKDRGIIELRERIVATAAVQLDNGVITPSDYITETSNAATARLNAAIRETQLLQARLVLAFIEGK